MRIVAIDTSGRGGSVALCRGDANHFEVLQLTALEGGTYSTRLMPVIASALKRNGLDKSDIDGFVVVSGPGSFTGLRVGLATVKGLCEVLQKPLATVSMLEALAIARFQGGTVSVVLDAGRGEVYVGDFRLADSRAEPVREYIAKLEVLVKEAAGWERDVITPDARIAEGLRAGGARAVLVDPVLADGIGRIGLRKLLSADHADPRTADVNYIRRSDADIFLAPKS